MLPGIIKIIFYAFLAYLGYFIYRFFKALSGVRKTQNSTPRLSGVMVKDEYCNTYLPKEDAIKEIAEGKEYYFCSNECRQKFLESKKH
ncbi:MAG: transcriptional regulator [Candidatus Aminicenantaceae bacterium]